MADMKWKRVAPLPLALGLALTNGPCVAQGSPASPPAASERAPTQDVDRNLLAMWFVDVPHDRPRLMHIRAADSVAGGWKLDATYGWADGRQDAIAATLRPAAAGYRIELTTPVGGRIVAEGSAEGPLEGTFWPRAGGEIRVILTRISKESLKSRLAQSKTSQAALLALPGADVPPSCARFHGGWAGEWTLYNSSPYRLWVVDIKPDCTARVSFRQTESDWAPAAFIPGQIAKGELTVSYGTATVQFEVNGDRLYGHYSAGGYTTPGVFERIK